MEDPGMDASALDHRVYEGRGWPRPRREPEPADEHAPAGGRGHRAGTSDETGRASVVSLVPDADARDRSTDFRTQLVDAMHAAARAQHSRIVSDVEERQAAYVSAVHSRASAEVDAMRATADDVSSQVASWAAAELERIEREREQRLDAARTDFQQRLDSHESRVEREIAEARARITAYRAEIEAFFAQLDAESDPGVIAQLAARVPAPPDLEKTTDLEQAAPAATAMPVTEPPEVAPASAIHALADAVTPTPASEPTEAVTEAAVEAAAETAPAALDAAAMAAATFPFVRSFEPSQHGHDAHAGFEVAAQSRRKLEPARDDLGWDSESSPEAEADTTSRATADEHIWEVPETGRATAAEHGDEQHEASLFIGPAQPEREPEPAAPTGKPKDLIRERLRYIAERRAALADVGAGAWSTEPAPHSRPI
jgi:hypothetical protein